MPPRAPGAVPLVRDPGCLVNRASRPAV